MTMERIQVSIRLPQEIVDWVDDQVRDYGRKTDRTEQIRICIEHRRIALLPREKREKLFVKLDAAASLNCETQVEAEKDKHVEEGGDND